MITIKSTVTCVDVYAQVFFLFGSSPLVFLFDAKPVKLGNWN